MTTAVGLQLAGVRKAYGRLPIIEDLSLVVEPGELLVLVGPSGSGKSTLLRMIAGLVPHDAGSIRLGGGEIGHLPPAQRDIGMVFQNHALFPHLTIRENLAFGLKARRAPPAEIGPRVAAVAESLGLAAFLDRLPRQLSGGERQRVGLGRALLREPKLCLLDEPLSSLDAQLKVQARAEILKLKQRMGTTMIHVTHDQIEALGMGDRIGVLRDGRLEQLGTPEQLYQRPANLFVATFLGSPAMNTVAALVGGPGWLDWAGFRISGVATQAQAGRPVTLGVRPEHVFVVGSRWAIGIPAEPPLPALVEQVESAGDQQYLLLDVGEHSLLARVEPDFRVQRGEPVRIWLHPPALHLFDPHSGERLALA